MPTAYVSRFLGHGNLTTTTRYFEPHKVPGCGSIENSNSTAASQVFKNLQPMGRVAAAGKRPCLQACCKALRLQQPKNVLRSITRPPLNTTFPKT